MNSICLKLPNLLVLTLAIELHKTMTSIIRTICFSLVVLFVLSSCSENNPAAALKPKPIAYGKIRDVTVIADPSLWGSEIGDTLKNYYTGPYRLLPQPEPILDVRHFSYEEFKADPLRKELRILFFISNLNDQRSSTAKMMREELGEEAVRRANEDEDFRSVVFSNKWAKGQLVIYLFGTSQEDLVRTIKRSYNSVMNRIKKIDAERLDATVYLDGEDVRLNQIVKDELQVSLRIPGDYFLAKAEEGIIWFRKEHPDLTSSNLIFQKVSYTDVSQFSPEGIKALRDSIGRAHVSSELPNTYMKINDEDLPFLTQQVKIGNQLALEGRGIWEIENDFMGGPFISYLFLHPKTQELIFMDAFVYSPGNDKRNYMIYLDYILHSLKI